ncbi:MAG: hypothetical protein N3F09_03940 [Bacteroidia bacterium]|nr:hypothetical protein [Bacteroidia bacterium]
METKKIYELHEEHVEWLKEVDFFRDELKIMQNRLDEIASKYTRQDVLKEVEHFQNQFKLHQNHLDELAHAAREHEQYLQNKLKQNGVAADKQRSFDHPLMRDRFKTQEKLFRELRTEFNKFLSKTM